MDAIIARLDPPEASGRQNPPTPHFLPILPRVSLEITRGKARERIRPVKGAVFLIGSAVDCDLVLGDAAFPEAYAYLYVKPEGVSIRRLGSGPELLVSGEMTEASHLTDGDRLHFGRFEFAVHIEVEPPRGGGMRLDHDWSAGDPLNLYRIEDAINDVQMLLAEIRQTMALPTVELRVFVDTEPSAAPLPSPAVGASARRAIA